MGVSPAAFEVAGTTTLAGKVIGDAVVWIDAPVAARSAHKAEAVLDQRNLSFFPHVLVVQVGTRVKFPNDDRVFHNVFSFHDGKRFDLGLYPVGAVRRRTVRSTRAQPDFLQHPSADGGVRDGRRHAVFFRLR